MSPGSKKKKQKSYAVERILDVREMEDGKKEYKIKWEGYPEEEASWVHEEKMDCPKLVAAFNKRIGQPLAPMKTEMISSSDRSGNSDAEGDRRKTAGGESAKGQNDEKTKEKKNETEEEMGEVKEVIGLCQNDDNGDLSVIVENYTGKKFIVAYADVRKNHPFEMLDFYEKYCKFVDGQ